MGVEDRGVGEGAAERLGLEDAHPLALDADPGRRDAAGQRGEGAVEAVGILPVAGFGLGRGRLPARPLEHRHHRVERPVAQDDDERRALHQVEARAGQEVEVGAGHQRHGVEILRAPSRPAAAPDGPPRPSLPPRPYCAGFGLSPNLRGSSNRAECCGRGVECASPDRGPEQSRRGTPGRQHPPPPRGKTHETDADAACGDRDEPARGRRRPGQDAGLLQRGLAGGLRPGALDRRHDLRRRVAADL